MQCIGIAGSNARWDELYFLNHKTIVKNEMDNIYFYG